MRPACQDVRLSAFRGNASPPSELRIALVAPFALHPKGTTRWRVMPLARALAAAGHQVQVVIPPFDWPAHSGHSWADHGVVVVNAAVPRRLAGAGHGVLAARLVRSVLDWRPDVVHCFKPIGYSGLAAAALLLRPRRGPLLVDADDWEVGWQAQAGYPLSWQRVLAWQERWLLRRADAVTAASHWLAAWITAQRKGLDSVLYLPNGVEALAASAGRAAHTGRNVLLYTRFVEHSPQQVWAVWRSVLVAEPAARLLVAGEGFHGEERALMALAEAHRAGASVRLLGWVPTASRPGLFAAADAALLPVDDTTLNRAKCPMRLAELLAAGVPVAAQAVGEYAHYVRHGETGLLAPAGDDAALAGAIVRLLRDDDLSNRLCARAMQIMQIEYAWSRQAALVEQVYRRVIQAG